jgi:hypothetical protein
MSKDNFSREELIRNLGLNDAEIEDMIGSNDTFSGVLITRAITNPPKERNYPGELNWEELGFEIHPYSITNSLKTYNKLLDEKLFENQMGKDVIATSYAHELLPNNLRVFEIFVLLEPDKTSHISEPKKKTLFYGLLENDADLSRIAYLTGIV